MGSAGHAVEGVRQVGSAGHAVPREAAEGNRAAALTRPFNQTALHARSAERREKANAENALAQQRRGMHGPGSMSVSGGDWRRSHARDQVVDRQRSEDVQQCLLRGAAAWAIGRVGQKPSDTFNGSSAQQLLQVKSNGDTASTGDSARLGSQGIEGRDLRWWLHSWQHWHQEEDRRLSGCTDFDAMHFAKTRRVRLGGAWGCVLAWMRGAQTTAHDTQLLDMIQATFRLAGTACERRTPGIIASGRDAQQMSDSSSGSGTGTGSGSGTGTGSDTRTERASGDQTASEGQPTNGQSGNNMSSEDNTSMVRRAMNNVELRLARSQATVIIHNLMQELTTFVTRSLGGATGERDAMMTGVPEEHRQILTTVQAQAVTCVVPPHSSVECPGR